MLEFKEKYNATQYSLIKNYRSSSNIVHFNNELLNKIPNRLKTQVLEPVNKQVLSNIKTSDSSVEFGKVIAADQRNTTLVISAPGNNEVYLFGRTTDTAEFQHLQTIEDPGATYYSGNGNFGKSVAIAEDGEFLAIGAPQASNVKTLYKGEFSDSSNYATNDIVSYKQNLWKANYGITAASGSFTFNSYQASHDVAVASYADGAYPETVYAIRGRYSFDGATDHILVRAPKDPYEGSSVNDKISLQWNQYSQNYPNGILPFGVNGPGTAFPQSIAIFIFLRGIPAFETIVSRY